ncbi:MAG: CMP deaminase [Actinobacteria bacterium BACL4 MAG-120920-bin74]|nr:MAG: CMP deaminase [Actinobacteria bacterium BACL4 MAG-120920-bin74]
MDYKELMQQALLLAKDAANHGDVPVGAIIVDEKGAVIGRGKNERVKNNDPLAHAEMVAIKDAASKLSNWRFDQLTLIVTLEPCAMCAGAIAQSRFKRLVFGSFDEKAGAAGSIWDLIRDARALTQIEVVSGVLADDCALVLSDFFASKR